MIAKVNILLSTYNGMRFLEDQIQSLLTQSYPHILITVRDDGSTDGTYEKLLEYAKHYSNFVVLDCERMGVVGSFFKLLRMADPDCIFYAFCDQDDVWLPNKISDAVATMKSHDPNKPLMYFSRLEYVDSKVHHLGYSKVFQKVGFANALVDNSATGCTIVLNRAARALICQRTPRGIRVHDWWCYLVVSAFGQLVYDERPNIKHRLHEGNVVGHPISFWKRLGRWLANRRTPKTNRFRASDQAQEFYRCYGQQLRPYELKILKNFLEAKRGIRSRVKYATKMEVWTQARWATFLLRIRIFANRF